MEMKFNVPLTEADFTNAIDYLDDHEGYYDITPSQILTSLLDQKIDLDHEDAEWLINCIPEENKKEVIKQFYDRYIHIITDCLTEHLSIED